MEDIQAGGVGAAESASVDDLASAEADAAFDELMETVLVYGFGVPMMMDQYAQQQNVYAELQRQNKEVSGV